MSTTGNGSQAIITARDLFFGVMDLPTKDNTRKEKNMGSGSSFTLPKNTTKEAL
jgi:hypothetical protein